MLQVGSKYHDFIESADAISHMQDATVTLGSNILKISELGKEVIRNATNLVNANEEGSTANSLKTDDKYSINGKTHLSLSFYCLL